jgi:predicted DNA-binding transcriptional regulator AlpA
MRTSNFATSESKSKPGDKPLAPWLSPEVRQSIDKMQERRLEALALLSVSDVLHLTGWSRSTLYRRIRASKFPRPVHSGGWRVGFVQTEVHAAFQQWLRERDTAESQSVNQS